MVGSQNQWKWSVCFLMLLIGGWLAGCEHVDDPNELIDTDEADATATSTLIVEGSAEAVGVLGFLNAATTTFEVLDLDVRLDQRAARGLIHHRNGPDGVLGTGDDDLFDTIAEVDAVHWVGDAAIGRLLGWADALGWVPFGDELLGVYDGVPFTVNEALIVVDVVNNTSDVILDQWLNKLVVDGIVANRPIVSLAHLAELPYVGPEALNSVRDLSGL